MPRSEPLVIRCPMPVNIANGRMHWAVKNKHRKAFMAAMDNRQGMCLIPAPPKRPLSGVEISSRMTVHQSMDPDNAVARHKWILDWLVTRGYLADDASINVRWSGFPEQVVSRKLTAEIVLTISASPAGGSGGGA